jgi:hypothetical protein
MEHGIRGPCFDLVTWLEGGYVAADRLDFAGRDHADSPLPRRPDAERRSHEEPVDAAAISSGDAHQRGLIALTVPPEPTASTPEQAGRSDALRDEYGLLAAMLASVWSASLFRVSLLGGSSEPN